MMKIGKVTLNNNQIVFISNSETYIIPYQLYKPEYLNTTLKAEVNEIRRTVTKVL